MFTSLIHGPILIFEYQLCVYSSTNQNTNTDVCMLHVCTNADKNMTVYAYRVLRLSNGQNASRWKEPEQNKSHNTQTEDFWNELGLFVLPFAKQFLFALMIPVTYIYYHVCIYYWSETG